VKLQYTTSYRNPTKICLASSGLLFSWNQCSLSCPWYLTPARWTTFLFVNYCCDMFRPQLLAVCRKLITVFDICHSSGRISCRHRKY